VHHPLGTFGGMGTKNRQRRADKARERARAEARRRSAGGADHAGGRRDTASPRLMSAEEIAQTLMSGCAALEGSDLRRLGQVIGLLNAQPPARVVRESEGELLRWLGRAWIGGWQPAEALRQARRSDPRLGRLMAALIAADHSRRATDTLHPRWAQQVDALGLPAVAATTGWLVPFGDSEGLDATGRTRLVIEATLLLVHLGDVQVLIPPPGAGVRDAAVGPAITSDDPILVKVRALLAQAESTTFEAEAEAFTAKAQELMARHAIDAALVWGATERGERPIAIRLPLDDPYADAKGTLLHVVASASRCRAVTHSSYGMCTVVGFAPDLVATELLFTSLLVQSATALQAEGAAAGPGARTRSRGFRSSFLLAYATRVGQRLRAVTAEVESDTATEVGDSLLPVLVAREAAVDDAVNEMFTGLRTIQRRGPSDGLGWARGTEAADRAQLDVHDLPAATRTRGELAR
jgi:hypothetical protein